MQKLVPFQRKVKKPNNSGIFLGLEQITTEVQKLRDLQVEIKAEHDKNQASMLAEHKAKMEEYDVKHDGKLNEFQAEIGKAKQMTDLVQKDHKETLTILKDKLTNGELKGDTPIVDTEAIARDITSKIRVPKDGEMPSINLDDLAKKAAKLVKVTIPEIKVPVIDHDAITEKVMASIVKDKKLKAKDIDGTETAMESYLRRYGFKPYVHGGGDTVSAGNNVTLTRNSNGTTTISAIGGSGFTTLLPTETPNGVTTVFTFSTATAQPSFIFSDGVWLQATSKSGVVNWTWNNGTKKATMTIPPSDDILGIV